MNNLVVVVSKSNKYFAFDRDFNTAFNLKGDFIPLFSGAQYFNSWLSYAKFSVNLLIVEYYTYNREAAHCISLCYNVNMHRTESLRKTLL